MRARLVLAAALAAALLPAATGRAASPCTAGAPCERVVPEAMETTTFQQFDGDIESAEQTLRAIEALAPGFVDVLRIGTSAGGRAIWAARVTDESVTAQKRQVAVSVSVHGNEAAGREGGLRYLEDLARWATTEPDHVVYAGDVGRHVADVLDQVELYVGFLNPDGWAAGDFDPDLLGGPGFVRGNANGADLNRDYPTIGWLDTEGGRGDALSEPETRAWDALVSGLPNLTTAADIHGELTSVNNAFSDLMWPAGQWDPKEQAQELQLAKHMIRTVERKFAEDGVVLQELFGPTIGQTPANVATAYDVVGYDDSGFMGDWFVSKGAIEIDVENFLSHTVPNDVWVGALEQAHVAAVRGNIEALLVEALLTDAVQPSISLGKVAYVHDPNVIGVHGSTRMRYFEDLGAATGTRLTALSSKEVVRKRLDRFDTIVVADMGVPADGLGTDKAAYVAALKGFAERGGQLVLTDLAVKLLDDLGVVATGELTLQHTNAGHVDFAGAGHRWEEGLFGTPSQTYYEVPLGFPATDSAPHHGVVQAAWEEVGGTTVGTVTAGQVTATVLGEVQLGAGSIAIFGAILPRADGSTHQPHGLADYAVTIAGGHVLHRILAFTRA